MWIIFLWGSTNVDRVFFLYFLGLFKGSLGFVNAYLVVFGLFLPKREEKKLKKIPTINNLKKNIIEPLQVHNKTNIALLR